MISKIGFDVVIVFKRVISIIINLLDFNKNLDSPFKKLINNIIFPVHHISFGIPGRGWGLGFGVWGLGDRKSVV